jgi:hypothetical protein
MPRHAQPKLDNTILEMAVRGYEAERDRISAAMAEIRAQLGQRGTGRTITVATGADHTAPKKRTMSASARARIAAAQRARWQAYKKAKAEPVQAAEKPKKRKLSAAGRRAIQLATKKRWAEYHKAQKQATKAKAKPRAAAKKAAAPEGMTASASV